ncbi:predicted protein [Phaeodactylum tricornutum CCAP 1055/1]|uniref:Uncharacterized protein n=3 Tax=Phaeodactylum tricornutum TaxID=2850 RepID=B7G7G9_PHATC|nr:predicted protein [Phaeodactylum tricornutum CCAP 1055/1]EEC45231.1 predicted protein [Phaeodactylum tricornutum CCAP 1055/1]|eukprot:XP_002183013.1 predicted protein [Phaeodactylum tricornutum CCAP 1055/1]
MLDNDVVQLKRSKNGAIQRVRVEKESNVIQLAAQLGALYQQAWRKPWTWPPKSRLLSAWKPSKNAGLVSGKCNDPKDWMLPEKYCDTTGVVYASSFSAMDAAVGEVMRFLQSKTVGAADSTGLVTALRNRLVRALPSRKLPNNNNNNNKAAFARLVACARKTELEETKNKPYKIDRKFLFCVLVVGNAELAPLAIAKAIAMAQDMLASRRAQQVVVVAGDNISGETLLPWLGCGFRALGATTTAATVEDAALPFNRRRLGMLLGAGGIGMVLKTELSMVKCQRLLPYPFWVKARLLAVQYGMERHWTANTLVPNS